MKKFTAKRLVTLSVLTALGLITFLIEGLFPPLFLPGAKMGLSNVFSLLALVILGPLDALTVVVVRTTLGSIFGGNMMSFVYSLSAGLVSVVVESLLFNLFGKKISLTAISVFGAVMHNVVQDVVFCIISSTPQMLSYLPYLALCGILAGFIVGFAVKFILSSVPYKVFARVAEEK